MKKRVSPLSGVRMWGYHYLLPEMKDFFSSLIIEKFAKRAFCLLAIIGHGCWFSFSILSIDMMIAVCSRIILLKSKKNPLFWNWKLSVVFLSSFDNLISNPWKWFFFSIFFMLDFFSNSESLTINRMGNMKKGQSTFCCQDVRISLPIARNERFLFKPHNWEVC